MIKINNCNESKELIIQANNLIEAFIDMTQNEYKFVLALISKIDRSEVLSIKQKLKDFEEKKLELKNMTQIEIKNKIDELVTQRYNINFKELEVTVKELVELLDYKGKSLYSYMKEFEDNLIKKSISIKTVNGDRAKYSWFSSIKYINKDATMKIMFNYLLIPYLLDIDVGYTKYYLENIRSMSSLYSIRIFQIIKQNQKLKSRKYSIEELRQILGIDSNEYKLYADFKRKVLERAVNEINTQTDMNVEYQEDKRSRKVVGIKFNISTKFAETETKNSVLEIFDLSIYDGKFEKIKKFYIETLTMMSKRTSYNDVINSLKTTNYCKIFDQALDMYNIYYAKPDVKITSPTGCLANFIRVVLNNELNFDKEDDEGGD